MKLKRTFLCLPLALLAVLTLQTRTPAVAWLGPSINHPERQWQQISTPHFVVHYYQGFEELARLAARIAEEGHEKITADLGIRLQDRIPIIITEDEFWNGYAEPARWRIVLDPRFALEATIGLHRFLLHEMTHIFNFLAVTSGSFASNLIKSAGLPAWFAEGLAQYEAEYWTAENDRMLRLHVQAGSLLTPAERNAFTALSGKGSEGYNEGYALVRFLFERYGREKLPELLRTYRNLNGDFYQAIQWTFGKPLVQIEADWRQELEEQLQAQKALRSETLPHAQELVPYRPKRTWYLPKPSPDGKWLAYQNSAGYPLIRGQVYPVQPLYVASLAQLKAYGEALRKKASHDSPTSAQVSEINEPGLRLRHGQTESPLHSATADLELEQVQHQLLEQVMDFAWAPDSQHLAYTLLAPDRWGNSVKAVEVLPLKTESGRLVAAAPAERILPGEVLHSPAWSPDGTQLALVREVGLRDEIIIYDLLEQKVERTVVRAPDLRQYQALSWSPNGQYLVAEVFFPGQRQSLLLLDPTGQSPPRQLTESTNLHVDKQPIWSPDSQFIYFISTRNGFANLYRYHLARGLTETLSDVWTGLEVPSFSADGQTLYYIRHHAQGTSLESVASTHLKPGPALKEELKSQALAEPESQLPPLGKTSMPQAYQPWLGLEVLVPVLGLDEKGDQLGFLVQSSDLLEQHSLNLLLLYGLHSARLSFNGAYVNRMFDTTFVLEVGDSPLLSFATDGSAYFIARNQQISLSFSRPLFNAGTGDSSATRLRRMATLELNASYQTNLRSELTGLVEERQLRQGWNNSLNLTWNANELVRANEGIRYTLNVSAGGPWIGSQYTFAALNGNFRHYLPLGEHTLAYRLDATAMTGETRPALLGGPPLSNLLVMNFQNIIPLRGLRIAELQGPLMAAASLEYRFPLIKEWNLNLGGHYLESLSGALFMDAGDAWFPAKRTPFPHLAVGLELRSEAILNYRNSFKLFLGLGQAVLGHNLRPFERGPEIYGGFANIF